jgi:hypothetical protein
MINLYSRDLARAGDLFGAGLCRDRRRFASSRYIRAADRSREVDRYNPGADRNNPVAAADGNNPVAAAGHNNPAAAADHSKRAVAEEAAAMD